jgi:hypothetical protein
MVNVPSLIASCSTKLSKHYKTDFRVSMLQLLAFLSPTHTGITRSQSGSSVAATLMDDFVQSIDSWVENEPEYLSTLFLFLTRLWALYGILPNRLGPLRSKTDFWKTFLTLIRHRVTNHTDNRPSHIIVAKARALELLAIEQILQPDPASAPTLQNLRETMLSKDMIDQVLQETMPIDDQRVVEWTSQLQEEGTMDLDMFRSRRWCTNIDKTLQYGPEFQYTTAIVDVFKPDVAETFREMNNIWTACDAQSSVILCFTRYSFV